ncbi:hypothetical protein G0U57_000602, partial [Chelydra serpentina]
HRLVGGEFPHITNHRLQGSSFLTPALRPLTDAGSIPAAGTDPTQPEALLTPTHPGNAGPGTGAGGRKSLSTPPETGGSEPSAAPELSSPVIAGVSAAAASLLLLLLGILCYRTIRGNTLMGEGKQLDVLPQDPGAEGLTYAELDGQTLQAKRGGPDPAPKPVLYATINVSQGPHGQHPRGSGCALPAPP